LVLSTGSSRVGSNFWRFFFFDDLPFWRVAALNIFIYLSSCYMHRRPCQIPVSADCLRNMLQSRISFYVFMLGDVVALVVALFVGNIVSPRISEDRRSNFKLVLVIKIIIIISESRFSNNTVEPHSFFDNTLNKYVIISIIKLRFDIITY
jgi:hypothetical protein